MDPLRVAMLRRHWPLVGAVGILVTFSLLHVAWFGPALNRYRNAVREAGRLGMSLDPGALAPMLPPRLFALISDNSLPATTVAEQSNSGTLTADLIGDINRRAAAHGLDVGMSEPGPVTQQAGYVVSSAHFRVRGSYGEFVALVEDLAGSGRLLAVERFSMSPTPSGEAQIDLYVSRCVLKRSAGGS